MSVPTSATSSLQSEESEPSQEGPEGPELRIWLATNNYPSAESPNIGAFVANLAEAWVDAGIPVCVAAPQPYWSRTTGAVVLDDGGAGDRSGASAPLLQRPPFWSFSNKTLRPGLSTASLSLWSFGRSLRRCFAEAAFGPSVAYAHFLYPAAHAALYATRGSGIPVVGALGEADFGEWEAQVGFAHARRTAQALDGIVAVSRENADYCIDRYGVPEERITVEPNGIDPDRFRPHDRAEARRRLKLPQDRPIIAFCGHLMERKGPLRVMEAIAGSPEIGAIFLGAGPQQPRGEQVLKCGAVPNHELAHWLSAADVFVSPTTAEGSPNSILEAIACGLPVVSSDIVSVHETLSTEMARLVDPMDTAAIGAAIRELVADPELRERMSRAGIAAAAERSLAPRAARIASWLRSLTARLPRSA